MRDNYPNRSIEKWRPVLQQTGISPEYWTDVAHYCNQHHNDYETDGDFCQLAMSLKVFSKLDMSKVMFTDVREICELVRYSVGMTAEQVQDIRAKTGLDVLHVLESQIVEEMSNYINRKIMTDGGVVIYDLINLSLVNDAFTNRIEITGHILSHNVYRYKKLKRVKSLIDERKGFSESRNEYSFTDRTKIRWV